MKQALLIAVFVFASSAPSRAMTGPDCGLVQDLCQCAALFSVLEPEGGDAAFIARLRERAQALRESTYSYLGQSAGDRQIDGWISAYREQGESLDGALELAKSISLCAPYLGEERSRVLVMP